MTPQEEQRFDEWWMDWSVKTDILDTVSLADQSELVRTFRACWDAALAAPEATETRKPWWATPTYCPSCKSDKLPLDYTYKGIPICRPCARTADMPAPATETEYPHVPWCNGSRKFPAGVPGHSCCCLNHFVFDHVRDVVTFNDREFVPTVAATPAPEAKTEEVSCGTAESVATSMSADTHHIVNPAEHIGGRLLLEWEQLSKDSKAKVQKWFDLAAERLQLILDAPAQAAPEVSLEQAVVAFLSREPSTSYFTFEGYCKDDRDEMVKELTGFVATREQKAFEQAIEMAAKVCEEVVYKSDQNWYRPNSPMHAEAIRALRPIPAKGNDNERT